MIVRKAFRYRAYLTDDQIATANQWSNSLRFLWNYANARCLRSREPDNLDNLDDREGPRRRFPTAFDHIKQLTELRAERPWLSEVPRNVSAQLLVELDRAWQRHFQKLADQPRWKKKGVDVVNLCEPHPKTWRLRGSKLTFPKLGDVRLVVHRPLEGTPKTCTLVRDGDQWFAAILCEIEMPDPPERTSPVVALDRGITNFVGTSDNALVSSPQYLKASLKQLARAQRALSRKKKGSKNYQKNKTRVMKVHRKTRRQRAHFSHVQSARFTKSHGVIVLEQLNVAGMVRGNCARGISDAGWSMFKNMVMYKQAWSGGSVQFVRAAYSSQECFACEHVDANSRRGERFCCTKCGHQDHADLNAAKVLLRRASRSVLPVEVSLLEGALRSRKV